MIDKKLKIADKSSVESDILNQKRNTTTKKVEIKDLRPSFVVKLPEQLTSLIRENHQKTEKVTPKEESPKRIKTVTRENSSVSVSQSKFLNFPGNESKLKTNFILHLRKTLKFHTFQN